MFNVVPFIPAHLQNITLHRYMTAWQGYINDPEYVKLLLASNAYTGLVNGVVVVVAGTMQISGNRHIAWAFLTEESKDYMLQITRAVKDFLKEHDMVRVETQVDRSFEQGHRWAKMLGFKNETPDGMARWGDDDKTYDLYARVKQW